MNVRKINNNEVTEMNVVSSKTSMDFDTLVKIKNGDSHAIATTLERYNPLIRAVGARIFNKSDREDFYQNSRVSLLETLMYLDVGKIKNQDVFNFSFIFKQRVMNIFNRYIKMKTVEFDNTDILSYDDIVEDKTDTGKQHFRYNHAEANPQFMRTTPEVQSRENTLKGVVAKTIKLMRLSDEESKVIFEYSRTGKRKKTIRNSNVTEIRLAYLIMKFKHIAKQLLEDTE